MKGGVEIDGRKTYRGGYREEEGRKQYYVDVEIEKMENRGKIEKWIVM